MEETLLQPEVSTLTRKNMEAYFATHDPQYIHPDGEYINMSTGEVIKGREAVGNFLHDFYHIAFDAKAVLIGNIITEKRAMIEGYIVGKHIGEFAGIPATQRDVNVPICVTYELEDGMIRTARIYILADVLFKQLTAP